MTIGSRSDKLIEGRSGFLTEIFCDICGRFVSFADDTYIKDYGLATTNRKISCYCVECEKIIRDKEMIEYQSKKKGKKMAKTKVVTEVQLTSESIPTEVSETKNLGIQWGTVDKLITEGKCKCSLLAKDLGMSTAELRKEMESHYNSTEPTVLFKKGRNGGVYWVVGKGPKA